MRELKSGSDIRGVAVGEGANLTPEVGARVGLAFARWLRGRAGHSASPRVAVGRDPRVSGGELLLALAAGLSAGGARALDCGLSTTPAMFWTTVDADCDGAVMVTASHLPPERNGYKFFTREGGLTGADIAALLDAAEAVPAAEAASALDGAPAPETLDSLARYREGLAAQIRVALGGERPLAGLRVAVDAGNGSGGFYAALLSSLGADVSGSQFLDPDGRFPNHIPNPEDETAMEAIGGAVVRAGADLGVIFDADCDRAALVDADGREINRNRLIALIAAVLLREHPGTTVVTDSVTSTGLTAFIESRGGRHRRYMRGYRNVIDEAKRLNDAGVDSALAIETSGHAAMRDNRFLDDGMALVTRLLIEAVRAARAGGRLTDCLRDLPEPAEQVEKRLRILDKDFRPVGEAAVARVRDAVPAHPGWRLPRENFEGVRVECEGGWFLLRMSLHDPLLVLNAESDRAGGTDALLAALRPILAADPRVDCGAL